MARIVTILAEGFADWETALLNGAARSYYGVETHYASPGGRPVTSMGGLSASPDLVLENLDPTQFDAVIVCGGAAWQGENPPDLTRLLKAARREGKFIGAICDGTIAAARTGILDDIAHTSNGVGYLDVTSYAGKAHYRDVPHAVTSHRIVTAPATAPVSFMAAIMTALGLANDDLDYFLGLHAAQHQANKAA